MPSPRIILDCKPLKDRNSGFSHFVVPLAHELVRKNYRYRLFCYVPPAEVGRAAAYYLDDFSPATIQQAFAAGSAQHSPARAAQAQAQARQFSWGQSGYLPRTARSLIL